MQGIGSEAARLGISPKQYLDCTGTARRLPVYQPHSLRTPQLYLDDNGLVPPR